MLFSYDLPTVFNALNAGENADILPRLTKENIEHIRSSPHFSDSLSFLKHYAAKLDGMPFESLRFWQYRQFDDNGGRGKETTQAYVDIRGRLNVFAILSMLYPEAPQYIQALEDAIWAICDEYTWSLTAHLRPAGLDVRVPKPRFNEKGLIDNSSYTHGEELDLFACETGFALSEITALLEDRLTPLIVYRARTECYKRILAPYLDLNGLWKWEKHTNNWAAVCGGSIGMTAMYLIKDSSVLTPILMRLIAVMDAYIGDISNDGACVEGPSYWRYGMSFFSAFADTLRKRTAGQIDLFAYDKIRKIAEFQQKIFMTNGRVVCFSDSERVIKFRLGLAVFLKDEYPSVCVPDIQYVSPPMDTVGSKRWCTDYRDIYWARNYDFAQHSDNASQNTEKVWVFDDAQQFIATHQHEGSTFCFAAKGGHNAQPHNHNDIGHFIYHVDGDSILCDLGRGVYSKAYSMPETRYTFLCNGSHGHSVPIVNGCFQQGGKARQCSGFSVTENENGHHILLEMQDAYDLPYLQSLTRAMFFWKDGKLTVTDICKSESAVSLTSRFISTYPPTIDGGGVRIDGEHASIAISSNQDVDISVSEDFMSLNDPDLGKTDIKVFLIDFSAKEKSPTHQLTFDIQKV